MPDPWLGKMLGCDAWHARFHLDEKLNLEVFLEEIEGKSFVDIKLDTDKVLALNVLQEVGFRLVDTNLTFHQRLSEDISLEESKGTIEISEAGDLDEEEVVSCAEKNFVFSRFHLDPRIDNALANQVKGEWARNFFKGERGEKMLVARKEGEVVGFCQLLQPEMGKTVIDLIGVSSSCRRRGVGRALVEASKRETGVGNTLIVGTQVANQPSVRLYESLGMKLEASQYVLHYHRAAPCVV
jgi:ribosomal protein S18 acetylase RimI-like enzyme